MSHDLFFVLYKCVHASREEELREGFGLETKSVSRGVRPRRQTKPTSLRCSTASARRHARCVNEASVSLHPPTVVYRSVARRMPSSVFPFYGKLDKFETRVRYLLIRPFPFLLGKIVMGHPASLVVLGNVIFVNATLQIVRILQ